MTIAAVLSSLFLLSLAAQTQSSASRCTDSVTEALGTSEYLLYGLNANCELFFAYNIPNGTDLNVVLQKRLLEQPSTDSCSNALLTTIIDPRGLPKLLLLRWEPDVEVPTVYSCAFLKPFADDWLAVSSFTDACQHTFLSHSVNQSLFFADQQSYYQVKVSAINKIRRTVTGNLTAYTMGAEGDLIRDPSKDTVWKNFGHTETEKKAPSDGIYRAMTDYQTEKLYLMIGQSPSELWQLRQRDVATRANNAGSELARIVHISERLRSLQKPYIVNGRMFGLNLSADESTIEIISVPIDQTLRGVQQKCIGRLTTPAGSTNGGGIGNVQLSALVGVYFQSVVQNS